MVPLKVYFSKGWVKVELALVKGKRKVDKRQAIKERDMKRELDRARKRGILKGFFPVGAAPPAISRLTYSN